MEEQPRRSQETSLLGLRDLSDELHAVAGHRRQLRLLRPSAGDDEPTSRLLPSAVPHAQQQVVALVRDKASEGDKERLGGLGHERRHRIDAVVNQSDPPGIHAESLEGVCGRWRDGHE